MHAGGLRYHGMAPLICKLYDEGVIEARAVPQIATFEAAIQFARAEGILPAPEAAHAVRGAIDEALRCKQEGKRQTIVFNLCGHGFLDLSAYEAYLAGKLEDYEYPTEKVEEALRHLPRSTGLARAADDQALHRRGTHPDRARHPEARGHQDQPRPPEPIW